MQKQTNTQTNQYVVGKKKRSLWQINLIELQMNHTTTLKGLEKNTAGLSNFGKHCFESILLGLRQKELYTNTILSLVNVFSMRVWIRNSKTTIFVCKFEQTTIYIVYIMGVKLLTIRESSLK